MTTPSGATMSLIVGLVLPLKIIIGGKINPSVATVRSTVTCLISEPEVRIVPDICTFQTKCNG